MQFMLVGHADGAEYLMGNCRSTGSRTAEPGLGNCSAEGRLSGDATIKLATGIQASNLSRRSVARQFGNHVLNRLKFTDWLAKLNPGIAVLHA